MAGKATLTVGPFTTVGAKVIEVRYSGDANTVAGAGSVAVMVQNQQPKVKTKGAKRVEAGDRLKVKTLVVTDGYVATGKVKFKIAHGKKAVNKLRSGKTSLEPAQLHQARHVHA